MKYPLAAPLKIPLFCEHMDKGLCEACRARLREMLELVNFVYGGPRVTLEDFT